MKVNLIFDLSLLFYRWAYMIHHRRGNFLQEQDHEIELAQGVHKTISMVANQYHPHINRIIMAVDSKKPSWRFDADQTKYSTKVKYKSDRDDHDFDHDRFINSISDYCSVLEDAGIYVIGSDYMEADDIAAIMSEILLSVGQSSIIVTSDSDLKQLIRTTENGFIYTFDSAYKKSKHYVDDFVEEAQKITTVSLEEDQQEYGGIFNVSEDVKQEDSKELIGSIYNNSKVIDPMEILMQKILGGDKSDSIPPVYRYWTKNKKKKFNFTAKRASNVFEKLESPGREFFRNLYSSSKLRRDLASKVLSEVKSEELSAIDEISENIKRNLDFVFLDECVYSEKIPHLYSIAKDVIGTALNSETLKRHKQVIRNGFDMHILDDSRFDAGGIDAKEYTPDIEI